MKNSQRTIVLLAGIALSILVLFPPWTTEGGGYRIPPLQSSLLDPPSPLLVATGYGPKYSYPYSVDYERLGLLSVVLVIVGGIGIVYLGRGRGAGGLNVSQE